MQWSAPGQKASGGLPLVVQWLGTTPQRREPGLTLVMELDTTKSLHVQLKRPMCYMKIRDHMWQLRPVAAK